ncbi:MAG: PQQ-binding-like beta-propeller repeat protein [Holophagales bacterium]|nr:PQQ-binding-like beta-propeller repeat protein [Holophagales bacterium]
MPVMRLDGVLRLEHVALVVALALSAGVALAAPPASSDVEGGWPAWRGPSRTGSAPAGNPPIEWSETQNVRWKKAMPGLGLSSPIVWGDRLYLTTAVPTGEMVANPRPAGRRDGIPPDQVLSYEVHALDRADGSTAWKRTVRTEAPHGSTHPDGTWASGSPVTDGDVLVAFFGSQGLYAFDLDGNELWRRDFGDMRTRLGFGEGSSPALHGDRVFVIWDHEDDSFMVSLDKKTGQEIWRRDRDEMTAWTTPLVVEHGGRTQVITSATNRVRAYDADTGEAIWQATGMTLNAIPSPVYSDGVVYLTSGFRGSKLMAVRLDGAEGDVTGTEQVVWSVDRDTPYVPSPLLHEGVIYFTKSNSGILSAFAAPTGEALYRNQRLGAVRNVYASPVGVGDRVYFTSRDGEFLVAKAGRTFEVLAENELDDRFDASPAIVGDEIYLRGRRNLYCIAAP